MSCPGSVDFLATILHFVASQGSYSINVAVNCGCQDQTRSSSISPAVKAQALE